jgi:desampylase
MNVTISRTLHDQLIALAAAEPTLEACGLLLGRGLEITDIAPAANIARAANTAFEIDPVVLIAAHRAQRLGGPDVIGHYHSHPNGRAMPSETDARMATDDGSIWIVIAGEKVSAWQAGAEGELHHRFTEVALAISD